MIWRIVLKEAFGSLRFYRRRTLTTICSLGWGVASDVSATVGGLPHVERTLNWVRIAARFPVRILLDTPPDDLMRYGATAVIVIEK